MKKTSRILAAAMIAALLLTGAVSAATLWETPAHTLAAGSTRVATVPWYIDAGVFAELWPEGTPISGARAAFNEFLATNPVTEGELHRVFYSSIEGQSWRADSSADLPPLFGVLSSPPQVATGSDQAFYSITFEGTQIQIFAIPAHNQGMAAISINGGPEEMVDFSSLTTYWSIQGAPVDYNGPYLVYTSPLLPFGRHTIRVRRANVVTRDPNGNRSGISFSYANVYVAPGAGPQAPPAPPPPPAQEAPAETAQPPAPQAGQAAPPAPRTFDPVTLAIAGAIVSAAGIVIAGKKKEI